MAEANKDTIYIDIDDEITAIIDKVRNSSSKVVALVLPKRATTLQSIVNMKLLKRAADQNKQNLVLVTTESGLMPLAGAVGLHVAKTPTSRPEIPVAPVVHNGAEEQVNESDDLLAEDEETPLVLGAAANKSVGELAGETMPLPSRPAPESGIETVELDNEDKAAALAPVAGKASQPKVKKDSKLKIPDFNKFRLLLILGGALLLLLIVGGYFALVVLPKATIAIATNASNVNTNIDFTLSTTATSANTGKKIVPAKQVSTQKTYTGTANASGQQNNGDKASGSVTLSAGSCSAIVPANLPSGSGLSAGGKTYITKSSTAFTTVVSRGKCTWQGTGPTPISAQNSGASYNTDSANFTVSNRSDLTATGSADGGTDDIQTVVSQADIDSAKGKIASDGNSVQDDLTSQLKGQGLYAIVATYTTGATSYTNSTSAGSVATSVTVTATITYTMLGTNEDDIKALVDNDIKRQIDTSQQGILTEGINQGAFKLSNATATGAAMNIQTTAEVGPSIDTGTVASEAAGKKSGDIKATIKSNPDVTDVEVKLSPFWVTKAPKNVNKITVTVAKPTKTANAE